MLFISTDDFFEKAEKIRTLSRREEIEYAEKMKAGDPDAREMIIQSSLPYVAASVKHLKSRFLTLELILRCCASLEKAVDSFDFMQDSERFPHRLNWWLRQTITRYIAEDRSFSPDHSSRN